MLGYPGTVVWSIVWCWHPGLSINLNHYVMIIKFNTSVIRVSISLPSRRVWMEGGGGEGRRVGVGMGRRVGRLGG